MANFELITGNSLKKLKKIPDNSIDSCVTDPPYELNFMSLAWDNTGIAYNISLWKEVFRVLKPGGHLLAFGGTRTHHRMVCAIEDAGFEIRDEIQWIYGQGFPKSRNISKAIDKLNGKNGKIVGINPNDRPNSQVASGRGFDRALDKGQEHKSLLITEPETQEAKQWSGWGTNLKPCNEPICLARKPISERTIELNVLKWGTGGINIDATRIELNGEIVPINKLENWSGFGQEIRPDYEQEINTKGRWPSNVIFDEEAGNLVDKQSGERTGCKPHKVKSNIEKYDGWGSITKKDGEIIGYNDNGGGASRFFYCAKTSKKEKNAGLETQSEHKTVKPISLMRWLCRLVTPPNGTVLDCFMGIGSTGIGANLEGFNFIGIELDEQNVKDAKERIIYWTKEG